MNIVRDFQGFGLNQLNELTDDECLLIIKALRLYGSEYHNENLTGVLEKLEAAFPRTNNDETQLSIFGSMVA